MSVALEPTIWNRSPKGELKIVNPRVVGIAFYIPVHLEMNAITVRTCFSGWIERLIDGILGAIQGKREKYRFSVVDFCLDSQMVPSI